MMRLSAEVTRISRSPEGHTMSPAEFGSFFEAERKKWAGVVAQGGVKLP